MALCVSADGNWRVVNKANMAPIIHILLCVCQLINLECGEQGEYAPNYPYMALCVSAGEGVRGCGSSIVCGS
jgi:hypothetical protein